MLSLPVRPASSCHLAPSTAHDMTTEIAHSSSNNQQDQAYTTDISTIDEQQRAQKRRKLENGEGLVAPKQDAAECASSAQLQRTIGEQQDGTPSFKSPFKGPKIQWKKHYKKSLHSDGDESSEQQQQQQQLLSCNKENVLPETEAKPSTPGPHDRKRIRGDPVDIEKLTSPREQKLAQRIILYRRGGSKPGTGAAGATVLTPLQPRSAAHKTENSLSPSQSIAIHSSSQTKFTVAPCDSQIDLKKTALRYVFT